LDLWTRIFLAYSLSFLLPPLFFYSDGSGVEMYQWTSEPAALRGSALVKSVSSPTALHNWFALEILNSTPMHLSGTTAAAATAAIRVVEEGRGEKRVRLSGRA